ncbi:uncharacterized protein LOC111088135 [Limulus polyphemus]|uniref:Uncharacterized protein LOC111088135 n=1 Tax=Limulus polyphemus TaxID=6850 RepID=A0ABM1TAN1_LIMPO|nr:uncharacterized protein LOC111088135 [Limulus polyphemus]
MFQFQYSQNIRHFRRMGCGRMLKMIGVFQIIAGIIVSIIAYQETFSSYNNSPVEDDAEPEKIIGPVIVFLGLLATLSGIWLFVSAKQTLLLESQQRQLQNQLSSTNPQHPQVSDSRPAQSYLQSQVVYSSTGQLNQPLHGTDNTYPPSGQPNQQPFIGSGTTFPAYEPSSLPFFGTVNTYSSTHCFPHQIPPPCLISGYSPAYNGRNQQQLYSQRQFPFIPSGSDSAPIYAV